MKIRDVKLFIVLICLLPISVWAQFPPAAGQPGSLAIHKDSSVFVGWATHCAVAPGWQNIADTSLGKASVGDSSMAIGVAGTNGVVSLGDGGCAVLTFDYPIVNGPSWDFAVFENSFSDTFLELAFIEVSSDGENFFRFPATSLTDTMVQVGAFDASMDAAKINNLAGKYRAMYGTPFDLQELDGTPGLDINNITHIKVIDVVGSIDTAYATHDAFTHKINDPWPTPFAASGFDLDAVGVIHQQPAVIYENDDKSYISVYPVPANNYIHVVAGKPLAGHKISLINVDRKTLKTSYAEDYGAIIDLSDVPAGIYVINVSDGHRNCIKKVMIVK
ncbi:MAG TPA: T9SS type A sorting domain-containing protein [Bacteroidales bacterium]|nr:T9SS type A sorting domain-containing protein [Bacteroidales bacterium]